MFWGHILTKTKPFELSKDDLSKILHVSNASLGINPKKGNPSTTFMDHNPVGKNYLIAKEGP